jgi:hypothetical protein
VSTVAHVVMEPGGVAVCKRCGVTVALQRACPLSLWLTDARTFLELHRECSSRQQVAHA